MAKADLSTLIDITTHPARIGLANVDIALHSDKYAVRITKGLEDILGVDKAAELLSESAAQAMLEILQNVFAAYPEFGQRPVEERLRDTFAVLAFLGMGRMFVEQIRGLNIQMLSPTSYLADGYLDHMLNLNWPKREKPFCHDFCGYLQAAIAFAMRRNLSSITVREIKCRTTGEHDCEFRAEVR
jgi:hypothetical protein